MQNHASKLKGVFYSKAKKKWLAGDSSYVYYNYCFLDAQRVPPHREYFRGGCIRIDAIKRDIQMVQKEVNKLTTINALIWSVFAQTKQIYTYNIYIKQRFFDTVSSTFYVEMLKTTVNSRSYAPIMVTLIDAVFISPLTRLKTYLPSDNLIYLVNT